MSECRHGMVPEFCADCTGRTGEVKTVARGLPSSPHGVPARWPGMCADCGDRFPAGTLIHADGSGGWLADCCYVPD